MGIFDIFFVVIFQIFEVLDVWSFKKLIWYLGIEKGK